MKLLCSKPSIVRKVAFREVFSHLGEKNQPLFFLELGQLVLYPPPPNSSPLDLFSFGELKSLRLAFLSVIACIKITASTVGMPRHFSRGINSQYLWKHSCCVYVYGFVSGICWLSGYQCYCRMCP